MAVSAVVESKVHLPGVAPIHRSGVHGSSCLAVVASAHAERVVRMCCMSFRRRPTCPNSWTPPQQSNSSVIKNEDKNHENEKATPKQAHIESIEDLAPTFSTASVRSRLTAAVVVHAIDQDAVNAAVTRIAETYLVGRSGITT